MRFLLLNQEIQSKRGVMLQDLSLGCENHLRQADLVPISGPKNKKRKSFQRQELNPRTPEV